MSDEFIKITEEKRILDAITVQSTVIVPVIKIFISFSGGGKSSGCYFSITPYAVVVVDPKSERVFSLSGEEIRINEDYV